MSTLNIASNVNDTPPSPPTSINNKKSKYPPGIQDIVDRVVTQPLQITINGNEQWLSRNTTHPTPPDSSSNSSVCRRPDNSPTNDSSQELSQGAVANDVAHQASSSNRPSDLAIHTVRQIRQSIAEFHKGMADTLREYFPRRFMLHLVEVPAFKHLEKALKQFTTILERFEKSLITQEFGQNECDIEYMLYRLRSFTTPILDEGASILKWWSHREGGQEIGQPLTGKSWRLRRIAIHDSNERLENLRKRVVVAETCLLQEEESQRVAAGVEVHTQSKRTWFNALHVPSRMFGLPARR